MGLRCLLTHAQTVGLGASKKALNQVTSTVLKASATHYTLVFARTLEVWSASPLATEVLNGFVSNFKHRLDKDGAGGDQIDEAVIISLASLFIERPDKLTAFVQVRSTRALHSHQMSCTQSSLGSRFMCCLAVVSASATSI